MKAAYFDCSFGVAGDMILGALLDAGADFSKFRQALKALGDMGFSISRRKVVRGGISATQVIIKDTNPRAHRHPGDFSRILKKSSLPASVRGKALKAIEKLANVEAGIHGTDPGQVHLHELSGVDTLVDVVGSLILLELMGIEKVYSGPVNVGGGTVKTEHGILPVPAPATVELLKGFEIFSSPVLFELATPTGALILNVMAEPVPMIPAMALQSVGYGAGSREIPGHANVLRVLIGTTSDKNELPYQQVGIVETNVDNMTPEEIGALFGPVLELGALDFFVTPILMKKNRPAWKLTVLTPPGKEDVFARRLLENTGTLGVRISGARRVCLERNFREIVFKGRRIGIKDAMQGNKILRSAPEYDDCLRAAGALNMPFSEVMKAAEIIASETRTRKSKK